MAFLLKTCFPARNAAAANRACESCARSYENRIDFGIVMIVRESLVHAAILNLRAGYARDANSACSPTRVKLSRRAT